MNPSETTGNQVQTISDIDVAGMLIRIESHLISLEDKADHLDEQVHGILRTIDEHRPLLARATALADPGAKVRDWFHRKERDAVHQDGT